MNNKKFYICEHCGNIINMVSPSGVSVVCCGKKMTELTPGVVEASHEKHIPVVSKNGNEIKVTVGSVLHPMSEEHSILWVSLITDKGTHIKYLNPADAPEVTFSVTDETPIEVYAYCNLHGLWKSDV